MSEVTLKIVPAAGGWCLDCDLPLEPQFFRSGAVAERVGRSLALKLTDAGEDVRLFVQDASRQTVAVHRYFGL